VLYAAARGLGDEKVVEYWLARRLKKFMAGENIGDPAYRDTFLHAIPQHQFIARARSTNDWHPGDVLSLYLRAGDMKI
jgi:hypothetical protein